MRMCRGGSRRCVELHRIPDDAKKAEDLEVEPAQETASAVRPEAVESGLEKENVDGYGCSCKWICHRW